MVELFVEMQACTITRTKLVTLANAANSLEANAKGRLWANLVV